MYSPVIGVFIHCKQCFVIMDTIAHKKETEGDNVPFRFIDRDKLKGRSTGIRFVENMTLNRSF